MFSQFFPLEGASWSPWLLDILLKSTVLLAFAGLASLMCWRASAALRHLIWTLAVIGVLLLPVLSAILPTWHVMRLPEWRPIRAKIQAAANMPVQAPVNPATTKEIPSSSAYVLKTTNETSGMPSQVTKVESPSTTIPNSLARTPIFHSRPAWSWYLWVLFAWGIGSVLVLSWLAYGYVITGRLLKHATPVPDTWNTDIPTGVRLLLSNAIAMPVVVGIRRPAILLPVQATEWTDDCRCVVLLHELAHLQRRDLLANLLVQIACVCYWVNPLVWVAAQRMRVERETACDDAVLRADIKASDYAAHLLTVASRLQQQRLVSVVGIAMACSSKVGKRIKGVLDARRNRRNINQWGLLIAIVISLLLLLPLAIAQRPGVVTKPQIIHNPMRRTPDIGDATDLLAAAKAEIIPLPQQLKTAVKDQLIVQLIIQEADANPEQAAVRASKLQNPFYASLALGGVAAVQLPHNPQAAEVLYRKAVERAHTITGYTGEYPTSLHFLFTLITRFPREQAREVLAFSRKNCMAPVQSDDVDDVVNQYPLLELAKATVSVEPTAAYDLLFSVAVKSNHYYASSEYLATYLAEQDLAGTLKAAEESYQTNFGGSSRDALSATLYVLARNDLDKALQGIWRMQYPDDEFTALTLAKQLLTVGKKTEAKKVIADVERVITDVEKKRGKSSLEWTMRTLKELHQQLLTNALPTAISTIVTPTMIDNFLKNPDSDKLEFFSTRQVVFRDKLQASHFVTVALPLAATINNKVGVKSLYEGSSRLSIYGFLVSCAAIAGDIRQALEIANKISVPELRASYLLEAYAAVRPFPPVVSDWPIHFFIRPLKISIE